MSLGSLLIHGSISTRVRVIFSLIDAPSLLYFCRTTVLARHASHPINHRPIKPNGCSLVCSLPPPVGPFIRALHCQIGSQVARPAGSVVSTGGAYYKAGNYPKSDFGLVIYELQLASPLSPPSSLYSFGTHIHSLIAATRCLHFDVLFFSTQFDFLIKHTFLFIATSTWWLSCFFTVLLPLVSA